MSVFHGSRVSGFPFRLALLCILCVSIINTKVDTLQESYGVSVSKSVMVPMRDGTLLATDIYFPARDGAIAKGQFPALMERTPYGKNGGRFETVGSYFASRGYVVVVQDIRGRFESEGEFYIYVNDGPDGYDATEWIAAQSWSDGQVGAIGGSYSAGTLHSLAALTPPALKAYFVREGTANYYQDGAGQGGGFKLTHNIGYALSLAATGQFALENSVVARHFGEAQKNFNDWLRLPARSLIPTLQADPEIAEWYGDWVFHPDFDDYWMQNGYAFEHLYDDFPDIPSYYLGGWYDGFQRGTITNYEAMTKRHRSSTKLIVGPWIHGPGNIPKRVVGDVDFGPEAIVDYDALRARWFDQVLKGKDTGILAEPPVRIFVMGGGSGLKNRGGHLDHGGSWHVASEWPPQEAQSTPYYFHGDGSLDRVRSQVDTELSSYEFNPSNPVPTIGGRILSGGSLIPNGPFDQRCREDVFGCDNALPLSARPDVLVFETPPLQESVKVIGPVTVKLWASSTAVDTDFTAKLVDVHPENNDYPSGYAMNLANGLVRARYRSSVASPELMEPNKVYEFSIDLWTTANVFAPGHRIRVEISSSNFPEFDINPNTGETIGSATRQVSAHNTIHHDRTRPSHVILPVMAEK